MRDLPQYGESKRASELSDALQVAACLPAAVARNVLQKSEVPGALDGDRQFPLLACRTMRLASWQNLAALVKTQFETLDVLVIDYLVIRKDCLLAATSGSTTTWSSISAVSGWSRRTITSGASTEARSLTRSALGRLVRLSVIHTCECFSLC